jgi:hypothetical protein
MNILAKCELELDETRVFSDPLEPKADKAPEPLFRPGAKQDY